MSLESIEPDTALELYLADKDNELADASLKAHKYRLGHFTRWCDQQDIENLNELGGRQLQRYRVWRRDEGDLSPVSEKTQMDTRRTSRWGVIGLAPIARDIRVVFPELLSLCVFIDTEFGFFRDLPGLLCEQVPEVK